ncbi:MAG: transposase [Gammaproteobacteria bacterium]|nr:transposase [Gammaproteobacteria bacterium]
MSRPQRIEYENAFYHVMNRGKGRQTVFHGASYFQAFLDTLEEVHNRFNCIIHAYCLMGNHYHLLIETPNANLGRIMRHINGVYTQRYNHLKRTDGPLFRGRYKAILVDRDAYLLQLSRYIHRNPIDMKRPLVSSLEEFQWSSYPAYIGKAKPPDWLDQEMTYGLLGKKQKYRGYENYVASGSDAEILQYYNRGNCATVIGNKEFKEWIYDELLPELEPEKKGKAILQDVSMENVILGVSEYYGVEPEKLTTVVKGPHKGNEARKIAMYLSQELASEKLVNIAYQFNLGHIGSVSFITHQIRKKKKEDENFVRKIEKIVSSIMKQAT